MVTVVGAGIAGLALATGLGRAGVPATVYERWPQSRDGAFLGLGAEAHQRLAELGVPTERLHAVSHPIESLVVADTEGRVFEYREELRGYLRRDLVATLLSAAAAAGADIRLETPVTAIKIIGRNAAVNLGDGSTVTDELVVAADGIDSIVRRATEPDRVPIYDGQNVIYAVARPTELPTRPRTLHFHTQCVTESLPTSTVVHCHEPGVLVRWAIRISAPAAPVHECGPQPVQAWTEQIRRSVPAAHDVVEPLLAATNHVHVTNARKVPIRTARPAAPPVVLIGDADHAITPRAGTGAADAIKDAAALSHAITEGRSVGDVIADRRATIQAGREHFEQFLKTTGCGY